MQKKVKKVKKWNELLCVRGSLEHVAAYFKCLCVSLIRFKHTDLYVGGNQDS